MALFKAEWNLKLIKHIPEKIMCTFTCTGWAGSRLSSSLLMFTLYERSFEKIKIRK